MNDYPMSADTSPATPPGWMTPLLDRLDKLVAALERSPDAPSEATFFGNISRSAALS